MSTVDALNHTFTEAQSALLKARKEGPTKLGRKMLAEGAQEDLLALYAQAMSRVSGGMA
jgi:hypothetical protein